MNLIAQQTQGFCNSGKFCFMSSYTNLFEYPGTFQGRLGSQSGDSEAAYATHGTNSGKVTASRPTNKVRIVFRSSGWGTRVSSITLSKTNFSSRGCWQPCRKCSKYDSFFRLSEKTRHPSNFTMACCSPSPSERTIFGSAPTYIPNRSIDEKNEPKQNMHRFSSIVAITVHNPSDWQNRLSPTPEAFSKNGHTDFSFVFFSISRIRLIFGPARREG